MHSDGPQRRSRARAALRGLRRATPQAAGAVAGTATTAIAGPVPGGIMGAVVGQSLSAVAEEFSARSLSPDERRRTEFVFREAQQRVWNRLAAGDAPADWVTADQVRPGAPSREVLEAGVWRAKDQFEERKLKHLAALLAWLLFHPNLSAADAQHFLALADRLRYRQLVLISVVADEEARRSLPDERWDSSLLWTDMALVMEAAELTNEGILVHEGGIHGPGSYSNINLARMTVLLQGSVLYEGMELSTIDESDRDELIKQIRLIGSIVVK